MYSLVENLYIRELEIKYDDSEDIVSSIKLCYDKDKHSV